MSKEKLRTEVSSNTSGKLFRLNDIPLIRNKDYFVVSQTLDGNAPKQFLKIYEYRAGEGKRRKNRGTWTPYIAKTAEKWYPHESVVEYTLNLIGITLGLRMNEVALYRINEQIRFCSKFFLAPNETLIHGAEILGEYLQDLDFATQVANNRNEARELFTFEFVREAVSSVFPEYAEEILKNLVSMLVFDAIVGNNDRHFYNWAVIRSIGKSGAKPRLAPIYDTARALFWNQTEPRLVELHAAWQQSGKLTPRMLKYVEKSEPRMCTERCSQMNHFQLIEGVLRFDHTFVPTVARLISPAMEQRVYRIMRQPTDRHFSIARVQLMRAILAERFRRLRLLIST